MLAPSPAPTAAAATATIVAASSQIQGEAHPIVVAAALFLYLVACVSYLWAVKAVFADEFKQGGFWDKLFVAAVAILMGLTLLIPPFALIVSTR
jgi:uncharacterized membrane protein YozB (DUF420 family)